MLLIADSGSTKSDWVLFESKEKEPIRFRTKGLNPSILKKDPLQKEFLLNENEVINNLYQSETPNKDLAEFAIFCSKYKDHQLMDTIIKKSISKFIHRNI